MYDDLFEKSYTLEELAKEAGIDEYILAERLEIGCPMSLALTIPEHMHLEGVSRASDGELYYAIYERAFWGSAEGLQEYIIKRRKKH